VPLVFGVLGPLFKYLTTKHLIFLDELLDAPGLLLFQLASTNTLMPDGLLLLVQVFDLGL